MTHIISNQRLTVGELRNIVNQENFKDTDTVFVGSVTVSSEEKKVPHHLREIISLVPEENVDGEGLNVLIIEVFETEEDEEKWL